MHEEGDEGVGDVFSSELEMIALNLDELNFLGFVEGLEADGVRVVPVTLVKRLNLHEVVEALEPLRLFRVDDGILVKHDEHGAVESRETGFVGGHGFRGAFFVVNVGKEDRVFEVLLHLAGAAEVASRAEEVLNLLEVSNLTNYIVNTTAQRTIEATRDVRDTHLGSTDGEELADFALHDT